MKHSDGRRCYRTSQKSAHVSIKNHYSCTHSETKLEHTFHQGSMQLTYCVSHNSKLQYLTHGSTIETGGNSRGIRATQINIEVAMEIRESENVCLCVCACACVAFPSWAIQLPHATAYEHEHICRSSLVHVFSSIVKSVLTTNSWNFSLLDA